jgi:CRP/FNR family cyclic AMP-dependent transcriptional regulator
VVADGFLGELAADERAELEELGSMRRYRRGDVLFHQGDDAGAVLVILAGHVKAAMLNDGREVILAFPGPGELLGELSAVDGQPRSGTVRAIDDVEALVIPGSAFRAFLEHKPRIALVLLCSVIARLRTADRQRVDYAVNDVVVRVAGRLVELCDRFGSEDGAGIEIGLSITQDELASWAGASREAVAKAMALLRTLGWVQTERRRILVLDLDALRRYAAT